MDSTIGVVAWIIFFAALFWLKILREEDKKSYGTRLDGKSEDEVELERKKALIDAMGAGHFLSAEELMDEETYTTTYGENQYIQNNNNSIMNQVCVLTPSFNSYKFIEFAKDIFKKLVNDGENAMLGNLVIKELDRTQLPEKVVRYDVCYLHNYIVGNKKESIKVLLNVHEADNKSSRDAKKYFLTFSRENQLLSLTQGEIIAINCPNCGGSLKFGGRVVQNCPYCGNTVAFAEYDWVLEKVERITDDTVVTNRSIVRGEQ